MLLLKATGTMPHGGGKRSTSIRRLYRVLYRWIEQGTPFGKPTDPVVTRIEVTPTERLLERDNQQLTVIAIATTAPRSTSARLSQFRIERAATWPPPIRPARDDEEAPGTFAVMARYQTHVAVFRGLVPLGIAVTRNLPPAKNFVDETLYFAV